MAYDEDLAARIRKALGDRAGVTEKKMFGGVAFLLQGSMFCGVAKDELMLRVGPEQHDQALAKPHVRPMDFTGRPMKGYVFVTAAGCRTDAAVAAWVRQGADFVAALPVKGKKRGSTPAKRKDKAAVSKRAR
jgi:TfoX/Sxy family transcriptional regulator of competence genes